MIPADMESAHIYTPSAGNAVPSVPLEKID